MFLAKEPAGEVANYKSKIKINYTNPLSFGLFRSPLLM
jgi:hypothetical protein